MTDKPTGTVTFLFTDIEGSTRLSQEYPDTLQSALDIHHAILKNAVESNNGYVFEIVGDAFCCAFQNAADAVKASVTAQLELANQKWEEAVIRIRIGIHSGSAEWSNDQYSGYITLARAARIMSSAYGEQIIISSSTYDLVKDKFDSVKELNVSFRDLGERRLKDVINPIRLYQIIFPGLREEFPPLKTLDARPNNLPAQLTSFIGRDDVLQTLKNLFRQTRLLTLIGSGGSGKTRLAMQTAADIIDDFSNGVFITEIASVTDGALVVQTLLNSLGIKEEPGRTSDETLTGYLKDKEMLIILDNCEHLINECANLAEMLLTNCAKLKIIATSREALNCSGEQSFRVPSLSLPDTSAGITPENIIHYESVCLFLERALSVNQNFKITKENALALAKICKRLDGIPLAIELAAVRTKILSVEKIYDRLDDRFNLLTGGRRTSLPRQQTLKALIDWSYDLLPEKEKILWSRLSVFTDGWTLESAEEICSDDKISNPEIFDLLITLVEKSIILYDEVKERYRILETIKQYGEVKLKQLNETDEILSRHLHYFMELSETAESKLDGSETLKWLEKLESEHGNLQSAIAWSVKSGNREEGQRLAGALGNFWIIRGYYSTGRLLLESILKNIQEISKPVLGKILLRAGGLSRLQGDTEIAKKFYEESLELSREQDNKQRIIECLNDLGIIENNQGNYEQAKKFCEESLALRRKLGDKIGISRSLNNFGLVEFNQGNYEQAQKFFKESISIKRELGDKRGISNTLSNMGNIALNQGDYEGAQKFLEEGLSIRRELGDKNGIAGSLNSLGYMSYNQGKYEQAKSFYEESLSLRRELGDKGGIAVSIHNLGLLFYNNGNYQEAQKLNEESLALRKELGDKLGIAESLNNLGNVFSNQEKYEQAAKFFEESYELFKKLKEKQGISKSLKNLGILSYNMKNHELALKYFSESLELSRELGDKSDIAESLIGFAGILCDDNNLTCSVKLLGAAETALKNIGGVLEIDKQNLKKKIINEVKGKLSDEEFEKYIEEGKSLSIEEAVKLTVQSM